LAVYITSTAKKISMRIVECRHLTCWRIGRKEVRLVMRYAPPSGSPITDLRIISGPEFSRSAHVGWPGLAYAIAWFKS